MSAKPTSRPGTQSKQQRPRRRARWATLLAIAPLFACAAPLAAASTLIGQPGDGLPDYVYDPATFLTNEGLPSYLASLFVASASGSIRYDNATPSFKSGTGATFTSTLLASLLLDHPFGGVQDGLVQARMRL